MAVNKTRSDAKATPEKVFAACDLLRRKHGNDAFRNEEVLAITGGGMSTVSRLVKLYRAYMPVIEANRTLDSKTSIELVMAVDAMFEKQLKHTDDALNHFHETLGVEIADIGNELDNTKQQLETSELGKTSLQSKLNAAEHQLQESQQTIKQLERDLIESRSHAHALRDEIMHTKKVHEQKIDRQIAQHQQDITTALEKQRKSMEEEKQVQLDKLLQSHKTELKEQQEKSDQKINKREERITALLGQIEELKRNLESANHECQLLAERHSDTEQKLESLIADKKSAIDEAQRINRQLIRTFQDHVSTNSDEVTNRLSNVVNVTSNLEDVLAEITSMLKKVKK